MDPEAFGKMLKGNVSSKTIGEGFGFGDKADCKFMQEILNQMMQSMFFQHPMAESMGFTDLDDPETSIHAGVRMFDVVRFPVLLVDAGDADVPDRTDLRPPACGGALSVCCGFLEDSALSSFR